MPATGVDGRQPPSDPGTPFRRRVTPSPSWAACYGLTDASAWGRAASRWHQRRAVRISARVSPLQNYGVQVTFDVEAEAYGRFMGRYSEPLAIQFAERAGVRLGQRAVDVGCGPGALTAQLVKILGAGEVAAIDPSRSFVEAIRDRLPDVEVKVGVAEQLPFQDNSFDVALAQLVVHFMTDPIQGLKEMRRVTRPGGLVGASVWDHSGAKGPLSIFWRAAQDLDPAVRGEADLPGTGEGQLAQLGRDAGLSDIDSCTLTVTVGFQTATEWWEPFTLGVGPAGAYVAGLDERAQDALRDRCLRLLPPAPFQVTATAWSVLGRA
ncbi:MAG: hypothetical protein QOF52_3493 [Propionibacteriaceae bacterium]|nr:Methyltransferase type 11 [Propionibacteriaceae bacterium]MDX6323635.1 hypothetical protein [Propionibacteriaceae bacterium]